MCGELRDCWFRKRNLLHLQTYKVWFGDQVWPNHNFPWIWYLENRPFLIINSKSNNNNKWVKREMSVTCTVPDYDEQTWLTAKERFSKFETRRGVGGSSSKDKWTDGRIKGKVSTFLSSHRLLFNLSQPLHELVFLALYPLLLFLSILAFFLFILQLSPEKFCNDRF